jgi:omega-amidase
MESFTLAVIQNRPAYDKERNVRDALRLIARARAKGADAVCLPEIFDYPYDVARLGEAAEANGATRGRLQEAARKHRLYLCTGSLPENESGRLYNRAYLLGPDGEILLTHEKAHLFDVRLATLPVTESDVFTPGATLATARTPLAVFGLLVCYDIRFPEAARRLALQGMEVLLVPAAFNSITGPAHWHLLFRTRAVENQCFVAAASPAPTPGSPYRAYGHSLIVDPWGTVLAEAGARPAVRLARLSAQTLADVRERLPLLRQRRPELYRSEEGRRTMDKRR